MVTLTAPGAFFLSLPCYSGATALVTSLVRIRDRGEVEGETLGRADAAVAEAMYGEQGAGHQHAPLHRLHDRGHGGPGPSAVVGRHETLQDVGDRVHAGGYRQGRGRRAIALMRPPWGGAQRRPSRTSLKAARIGTIPR